MIFDREVTIGSRLIPAKGNLLADGLTTGYIHFYKETDAFFNSPQYIVRLNNHVLDLHGYYTFYFRGTTKSGDVVNDSTIAAVE